MTENTQNSKVLDAMKNYYSTPNVYLDQFMAYLTSDEWKMVSYACRRIFGFHQFDDHISISQFCSGAMLYDGSGYRDRGTGLCKSAATKCLASLEKFRLMEKIANNNPLTNKGALWRLELDYSKVNINALEARHRKKCLSNRERMEKPRSNRNSQLPS